MDRVREDVEQLGAWYRGTTKFGMVTPSYMNITSIDQLKGTDAKEILGIKLGAVIMERIPDDVVPEYGLKKPSLNRAHQVCSSSSGTATITKRTLRSSPGRHTE